MGPALQYFMPRPGPDPRGVALEPFVHQVGGHSCILRFDSGTVCKVLIRREHDVYHSLPAELRPFTPQYRGVVLVRVEQSKTGSILLIAHPAGMNHVSVAGVCCPKRNRGTSWGREGERVGDSAGSPKTRDETLEALKQPYMLRLPLSGCPPRTQDLLAQLNPWARRLYQYRVERLREEGEREFLLLEDLTQGFRLPCVLDVKLGCRQHGEGASLEKQRSQSKKCELSTSAELGMRVRDETLEALKQPYMLRLPLSGCPPRTQDLLAQLNPWARRLYQYRVERLREEGEREFLLLEDLTQGFRLPCVLDVKLGCRQHGEGASLEKQRSQSKKCELSTSAELGMRVCGMQVFQLDSDQMIFLNKYLGRSLSAEGCRGVLGQFFHSGAWLRREVIAGVLTRLGELREIVERQEGYRFYSSSLLILYEGAELDSDQMIFLNKYLGRSLSAEGCRGVLGQFFHSGARLRREVIAGVLTRLGELKEIVERQEGYRFYSSSLLILYEGAEPCSVDSVRFDVRLIDFAHTSSPLFSSHDGVTHGGSDAGLLLGLRSLQGMLGEILRQDREGREGLQRPTPL
ncbi:UNVERIFIED_CONTAM: hypothetical protein FKN15_067910 [Acipenser sinensis]